MAIHPDIQAAVEKLPPDILDRSGKVFYSGASSLRARFPLYIIGLNPGGNPAGRYETVSEHFLALDRPDRDKWSEYLDESWESATPGKWGMQPRVLHMLGNLGFHPHDVPSSNLIFVRSKNEADLKNEKKYLIDRCWPVHQAVIDALGITIVSCFGGTAGLAVRGRLGAHEHVASYTETNCRKWTSHLHRSPDGRMVLTLAHPSIAAWTTPNADPTPLVRHALTLYRPAD